MGPALTLSFLLDSEGYSRYDQATMLQHPLFSATNASQQPLLAEYVQEGDWSDVSGDNFLRKLLGSPMATHKYNFVSGWYCQSPRVLQY